MKLTLRFVSFIIFIMLFFVVGCKTTKSKICTTDWSLPSVKLAPTAKDEKVVSPAEKANAEATASLARDRLKGHNPSAAIRDTTDQTLRPNPTEIAQLNRFEGNVPQWATENSLPPGPEAAEPTPAGRVAQNVNDSTIYSVQDTTSTTAVHPTNSAIPSSIQLDAPQSAMNASVSTDSMVIPTTLEALPATIPPTSEQNANAMIPQAGSTMLELPDALPPVLSDAPPATAVAQTVVPNATNTPPGATVPSFSPNPQNTQSNIETGIVSTPTQPAVLFMPGNINPQYPNESK